MRSPANESDVVRDRNQTYALQSSELIQSPNALRSQPTRALLEVGLTPPPILPNDRFQFLPGLKTECPPCARQAALKSCSSPPRFVPGPGPTRPSISERHRLVSV